MKSCCCCCCCRWCSLVAVAVLLLQNWRLADLKACRAGGLHSWRLGGLLHSTAGQKFTQRTVARRGFFGGLLHSTAGQTLCNVPGHVADFVWSAAQHSRPEDYATYQGTSRIFPETCCAVQPAPKLCNVPGYVAYSPKQTHSSNAPNLERRVGGMNLRGLQTSNAHFEKHYFVDFRLRMPIQSSN